MKLKLKKVTELLLKTCEPLSKSNLEPSTSKANNPNSTFTDYQSMEVKANSVDHINNHDDDDSGNITSSNVKTPTINIPIIKRPVIK